MQAKIILDSISPLESRLITYELTYPRFIHAEFMTHRVFSRNAASSRAIPIEKMIEKVKHNPAQIVWWGKNQSGMQAKEELEDTAIESCMHQWNQARDEAITRVNNLSSLGLHKQIANRLLEPFMNITVICTGTDWENFFALRCHEDAQPEIRRLAYLMLNEYYNSSPQKLDYGEWHTPYLTEEEQDLDIELRKKISVAKSARVSYLTHDGKRDYNKDLELFDRLLSSGHMSPMEHVATPSENPVEYSGNFRGWEQYRKTIPGELRTTMPTKEDVEKYFAAL